jgi:hypothetical protein
MSAPGMASASLARYFQIEELICEVDVIHTIAVLEYSNDVVQFFCVPTPPSMRRGKAGQTSTGVRVLVAQ